MICPEHKMELVNRQGISKRGPNLGKAYNFWGCPAKDDGGYCKFTQPGVPAQTPAQTVQREALTGQVLANIVVKLDKLAEGQKLIVEMLSSLGGREAVKPSTSDKPLPF